jgi:hypothetical protein
MENRINIAEILKKCPKGMELDCTMFEDVKFIDIDEADKPICIRTGDIYRFLTKFGTWTFDENAKCVIFPKGKTTWEGFVQPVEFKDGDIVFYDNCVSIFKEWGIGTLFRNYVKVDIDGRHPMLCDRTDSNGKGIKREARLATEEEKEKLFKAIEDKGYRWNPETKTLEKSPKFKVGDKIRHKKNNNIIKTISHIYSDAYALYDGHLLYFKEQDQYELVTDKFDISKLKPFDKVLVRDFDNETWEINFFSKLLDGKHFKCLDLSYVQCIPYEGNEHLFNTTNKCDEFFKVWKS